MQFVQPIWDWTAIPADGQIFWIVLNSFILVIGVSINRVSCRLELLVSQCTETLLRSHLSVGPNLIVAAALLLAHLIDRGV